MPYDYADINNHKNSTESQTKPMTTLQEKIHRDFFSCYSEDNEENNMQENCEGSKTANKNATE